jgi:hypothetical protein
MPNLPATRDGTQVGCARKLNNKQYVTTLFFVNEMNVKRQKKKPKRCARSESPIVAALEAQLGNA